MKPTKYLSLLALITVASSGHFFGCSAEDQEIATSKQTTNDLAASQSSNASEISSEQTAHNEVDQPQSVQTDQSAGSAETETSAVSDGLNVSKGSAGDDAANSSAQSTFEIPEDFALDLVGAGRGKATWRLEGSKIVVTVIPDDDSKIVRWEGCKPTIAPPTFNKSTCEIEMDASKEGLSLTEEYGLPKAYLEIKEMVEVVITPAVPKRKENGEFTVKNEVNGEHDFEMDFDCDGVIIEPKIVFSGTDGEIEISPTDYRYAPSDLSTGSSLENVVRANLGLLAFPRRDGCVGTAVFREGTRLRLNARTVEPTFLNHRMVFDEWWRWDDNMPCDKSGSSTCEFVVTKGDADDVSGYLPIPRITIEPHFTLATKLELHINGNLSAKDIDRSVLLSTDNDTQFKTGLTEGVQPYRKLTYWVPFGKRLSLTPSKEAAGDQLFHWGGACKDKALDKCVLALTYSQEKLSQTIAVIASFSPIKITGLWCVNEPVDSSSYDLKDDLLSEEHKLKALDAITKYNNDLNAEHTVEECVNKADELAGKWCPLSYSAYEYFCSSNGWSVSEGRKPIPAP